MGTMILISVLTALAGVVGVVVKNKELPKSISSMVYELPKKWQFVWILWVWVIAFTSGIPTIEYLGENVKVIGFVYMAALMFTGALPLFNSEVEKEHYVCAIIAGVVSQVCVALISPWWLLLWFGLVAIYVYDYYYGNGDGKKHWYDGKGVFICEVICYVALILALLVNRA